MPDGTHRRHTAIDIFKALRGIGVPKDVVVVTEADIEKYGQNRRSSSSQHSTKESTSMSQHNDPPGAVPPLA